MPTPAADEIRHDHMRKLMVEAASKLGDVETLMRKLEGYERDGYVRGMSAAYRSQLEAIKEWLRP